MTEFGFTIIIATHNRQNIVGRAIESVLKQNWPNKEIIVVDDASTDDTATSIPKIYPEVRFIHQEINKGPGPARNRGICKATYPWALILDDDDTLLPNALETIANKIKETPELINYPVVNFATSNSMIMENFLLIKPNHYLKGIIKGDFLPVIQISLFTKSSFEYPDLRVGAESLLWLDVADKYGIPTWSNQVSKVHADAPNRLTSFYGQIKRAEEYAQYQDLILEKFCDKIQRHSIEQLSERRLGSATYWLLAEQRHIARERLKHSFRGKYMAYSLILWILTYLPIKLTRQLFIIFKRKRLG